ncbi:MAG: sulfatase [Pseudomonadaceae bacterium]|nr:sulfatase [Pseudomonadaceae bacterium]
MKNWVAAVFVGCTLWSVSACGGESSTSALQPSEQAGPSTSAAQPNVIVLFADDLGYGDIGSFGHPYNRTPNIDELAAQGQRWTDFYVAAPVCSPSRGALLTGRLPVRTGLYGETIGVYFPNDPGGFPDGEVTLPEALQEVGYRTGIFGKWHLGDAKHAWPTRHGFDEWLGLPYSNDMDVVGEIGIDQLIALSLQGNQEEVAAALSGRAAKYADPKPEYWRPPLFHSVVTADGYVDEIVEQPVDQSTLTKRYTAAAIDFIKRAGDEPFFIYLPYTMPHTPLFRSEDFVGQSIGGRYGDVIEEIDWSVGAVKQALEDSGNADNTLVIFTSDNGPWLTMEIEGGQAGLLRHGKGTTFEGGMRVPTVMWWPGRLQPGVVSEVGSAMDVFNTVASLAGADASTAVDGVDLSPVLFDGGESPRDEVAFYRRGQLYAYRKGPWKAHFITEGAYQQPPGRAVHDTPVLYHLHTDPSERFDVAADNPDVLAEIDAAVQQHLAGMQRQPPEFDKRLQR